MTLQSTVAKLLTDRDKLTATQCTEQIKRIGARLQIIRARVDEITRESTGRGKLGPEREKIAETGSPADLIKLNEEEDLLNAEDSSLSFQRDALIKRRAEAVISEAPGLARSAIRKLPAALKAAEASITAQDKAIAKLESIQVQITEARKTANLAGVKCPFVKLKMFERMAWALGWYWYLHFTPRFVENGRRTLHRYRLALTDYDPELKPIFPEIGDAAKFNEMKNLESARERQANYLRESRIPPDAA